MTTEQKSVFKGTIVSGDGTLKTFPVNGGIIEKSLYTAFGVSSEIITTSDSSHVSALEAIQTHKPVYIPVELNPNPRSPELQHWMNEHRWVWTAMAHAEISVDTATVLMKYCAQEIDWQTQAERTGKLS